MNCWNIPEWLEREVIERDRYCVYCGVEFTAQSASRRDSPSWEHIINDPRIITQENIARCCVGCNASKGAKNLAEWLSQRIAELVALPASQSRRSFDSPLSHMPESPEQSPHTSLQWTQRWTTDGDIQEPWG